MTFCRCDTGKMAADPVEDGYAGWAAVGLGNGCAISLTQACDESNVVELTGA